MEKSPSSSVYFAALNTAEGFKSYFSEIFGDLHSLYIIKGGPGTGKSRFMKSLGQEAERRGKAVEYFLCSSDPTSLDGVIFTDSSGNRVGIIDGTAPHSYEPTMAGVKEHILNFGDFWDTDALVFHKAEIEALSRSKKRLYSSFYSYLSGVRSLDCVTREHSVQAVDFTKMNDAIRRILKTVPSGDAFTETVRIRSAASCDGTVTLDTYSRIAKKRYAVMDVFGSAEIFMTALKNELVRRGSAVTVSYSPFSPSAPDAIYVPTADTAFYIGCDCAEGEKTVNMRRFVTPEKITPYKTKLRETNKTRNELIGLLRTEGASIRALHAEIERLYGKAMDFSKNDTLLRELSAKIF